jgi:inorganic pyrophosphatase
MLLLALHICSYPGARAVLHYQRKVSFTRRMRSSINVNPTDLIPPREPGSGRVHVIIDTPAGSQNKYKYDPKLGLFRISRVLPAGMTFPHDFGSIPGTRAGDGDPLDVLVLGLAPAFPGCLATVRLIGLLRAWQVEGGKRVDNDRLIGVAETPVNRTAIRDLNSLDSHHLHEIEHFFESYNRAQGRKFRIAGRAGRRAAESALSRAIRANARQAAH